MLDVAPIQSGQPSTTLPTKLLDMLATPGDVFDEVVATPPRLTTWLVPTLLVSLAGLVWVAVTSEAPGTGAPPQMVQAGATSAGQAQSASANWQRVSALAVALCPFAGTFWSAFLLWFFGRAFLKSRFSFGKALEVTGLTNVILALGTLVMVLLIVASGDAAARPSLALFVSRSLPGSVMHRVLDSLNFFHLWTIGVLAMGLARLSGASFEAAAFWVFGYWLLARAVICLLA